MQEYNLSKKFMGLDGKPQKVTDAQGRIIVGEDGKPIEGESKAKFLANLISGDNKLNALKSWNWALTLFDKEKFFVDDEDRKLICAFIRDHEKITVLAKAQLLADLEKKEEKPVKKEKETK